MEASRLTRAIKERALEVGFDLVGICSAEAYPEGRFLASWVEAGYAGEMDYMKRDPRRRMDVRRVVPWAVSVVCCALGYNTRAPLSLEIDREGDAVGWVSRYAWGDDYHDVMRRMLRELEEFIRRIGPEGTRTKSYVDTGPVLDRLYARYAGLGWWGKNTCIINERIGSWVFLGEVVTDMELRYDSPVPDRCGTCTRCIDACSTGALVGPYVLDASRCISYLTIELKGKIPPQLRPAVGSHLFGCDICQDVCPWNRRAPVSSFAAFRPRDGMVAPSLSTLAGIDPEGFRERFRRSPLKRAKRRGLLRNLMVAMANSGRSDLAPLVTEALGDEEPLVRAHAVWALWRLKGEGCRPLLIKSKSSFMWAFIAGTKHKNIAVCPKRITASVK